MRINPSIFKAYDIRGIYPTELTSETAYAVGRAYATLTLERRKADSTHPATTGRPRVAIGSDMRTSSPLLKSRLIEALTQSGIDVDDIGLVSTPTFYFAVSYFGYQGGIQVSASHNPKEWNGFKIVGKGATPMSEKTGLSEMQAMIEHEHFVPLLEERAQGETRWRDHVVDTEVNEQMKMLGFPIAATSDIATMIKPFKVAIDGFSGMGSVDMDQLFDRLPCKTVKLNFTLDGTFPAHPADPMKEENTAQLRKAVVDNQCDFGIAPDGDGDRYFFIDEKGQSVPQAIIRGLMARIELQTNPDAIVAYDVRPGRITADIIEEEMAKNGGRGKAIITPVGHSAIKQAMLESGAVFGGESSGHYFYKLPYGTFEAPTVLMLKFLTFMGKQVDADGKQKTLSQIVLPYRRYFNSGEINLTLPDRKIGIEKISQIAQSFADGTRGADGLTLPTAFLDGVTVTYEDYWFNVRLSNTEPLIRFTVEARSRELMDAKVAELQKILTNS